MELMAEGLVLPYLDIPFQHASPSVLKAMRRPGAAEKTLERVVRWRGVCPDLAIRSTFIVGFPGETEAEFAATLRLVEEVGFAQAYSFKYSARPGTPGAKLADQVSDGVKIERLARLKELLDSQQTAFNARFVGRTMPVLFERPGRRPGQLIGRSPYLQSVHAEAPAEARGQILPVEILSFGPNSLAGVIRSA
jgi:tRNA-2-methylthio-N6-dimethylallyladenosine synthase